MLFRSHTWVETSLLEILHNNWPEGAGGRITSIPGEVLTSSQRVALRRGNANFATEMPDGTVYVGEGGLNASGNCGLDIGESDRIFADLAYWQKVIEDNMVRRIPQGMIQVVLKISAWGTQGIANTVRSARDSVLVLRVGGQIVRPVQRAMWVGDFSPGLPIYQINTITSGRSSLTIVNPVGDAFAHGNVFLSSLIRESDVPPGENVELGCWKKGEFQPEFKLDRATLENSPSRRNP